MTATLRLELTASVAKAETELFHVAHVFDMPRILTDTVTTLQAHSVSIGSARLTGCEYVCSQCGSRYCSHVRAVIDALLVLANIVGGVPSATANVRFPCSTDALAQALQAWPRIGRYGDGLSDFWKRVGCYLTP